MQGFEKIVHGGFISMLLDEAMAKACLQRDIPAMTARIQVRFRRSVFVGEPIEVRGKILDVQGKKIITAARCTGSGGEVKATAEGLFMRAECR